MKKTCTACCFCCLVVMCETPLPLRLQAGAPVEHGQHAPPLYPVDWGQQISHLYVCDTNYTPNHLMNKISMSEWVFIMHTAWIIKLDNITIFDSNHLWNRNEPRTTELRQAQVSRALREFPCGICFNTYHIRHT